MTEVHPMDEAVTYSADEKDDGIERSSPTEGSNRSPSLPSSTPNRESKILAIATQGSGGSDEARMARLLERTKARFYPFDRSAKKRCFREILGSIKNDRPDLVVMEGTGTAGGVAIMLGKLLYGVPYVVSSGDAVGPFLASFHPLFKSVFNLYERLLCRHAAGFIGWTPYLVGRALTFGTPRAMTAPGFSLSRRAAEEQGLSRRKIRDRLGIAQDSIVVGVAGSLRWNKRYGYCYGSELVKALVRVDRPDLVVLIIGSGDGRIKLEEIAGSALGSRCILTGQVPWNEVGDYLAAIDVGSLPQSVDQVGSFRYTTKIAEYVAAGMPIIVNQIPLAYDLDTGWMWRMPGESPWDERFLAALAEFLRKLTRDEIDRRRALVPADLPEFDAERQIERVTAFIQDLIENQNA
jgi:glycosyltransferase involved in cell wall biosynthesis